MRKIICAALAAFVTASAQAAPPTVVPSPGYDARLQEQRAASAAASASVAKQVAPRHHRHRHVRR